MWRIVLDVPEWSDMSICGLLCLWASTIQIQLNVLVYYKADIVIITLNVTYSRYDMAENFIIWCSALITHSISRMNDLEQTIVILYPINCDIKILEKPNEQSNGTCTIKKQKNNKQTNKQNANKQSKNTTRTLKKTRVNEVFAKVKSWVDLHEIWNIGIFSGNEKLNKMTEHNSYILRIELEDFENRTRYAVYQTFTIANAESKYRLGIGGYSGDAGLFIYTLLRC